MLVGSLFVAILQIPDLSFSVFSLKPWLTVVLSMYVFGYAILDLIEKTKEEKYSKNTGILRPKKTKESDIIWNLISGTISFPDGLVDLHTVLPMIDIKTAKLGTEPPFKGVFFTASIRNGRVLINTIIKNDNGQTIAEMANNEWIINKQLTFDRNFDENALEVKDQKGHIVFQIEIQKNILFLQGRFIREDKSEAISTSYEHEGTTIGYLAVAQKGTYAQMQGNKKFSTKPMFKYPSDIHKGERIKK
jgi:hypothetical protein